MSNNKKYKSIEERPKKKLRCGCGGHSFNVADMKDKSINIFLKTGQIDKDCKAVKKKNNINRNLEKRKAMKLNDTKPCQDTKSKKGEGK